jgi:hydrogenase/urease accessory protein HupE
MWFDNLMTFIELGFRHILPLGLDHILFIIAIFLNARSWQSLLLQATTFTLAHTITLGLAAAGLISAPAGIVEPLIALSIAVLAIEAIFFKQSHAWRLPVIFAFGLFHGLGFGEIMKAYLTGADFAVGLAGFTIGVELGQLAVLAGSAAVAFAVGAINKAVGKPELYRRVFVQPVAAIIALVGLYWTAQRIGLAPGGA